MKKFLVALLMVLTMAVPALATVHVTEQYLEKDANGFAKVRVSAPLIEFFNTSTMLTSASSNSTTITVASSSGFAAGDHVYVGTLSAKVVSSVPGATSIILTSAVTANAYTPVVLKRDVSVSTTTDDHVDIFRDVDSVHTIIQPFAADTYGSWSFWIDTGSYGRRVSTSSGVTLALLDGVSYAVEQAAGGIANDVQCTSCTALTTETSGNYVQTVAAGTAIDVPELDSEGATKTVSWDSTEVQNTTFGAGVTTTLPFTWTFDSSTADFTQSIETNGFTIGRTDASTEVSLTAGDTDSRGSDRMSDGSANFLKLRAATGMSADYTLDFPAAVGLLGQTLVTTNTSGALGWEGHDVAVYKTGDENVQNSVTFQDDNHLTFAVAGSGAVYAFEFNIVYSASATGDIKLQLTGPASPTLLGFETYAIPATESAYETIAVKAAFGTETTGCTTTTTCVSVDGGTGVGVVHIKGVLINVNAGSVTLQWAQRSLDGGVGTQVLAGSYMTWRRVA